jgi:two-component system, NarL family, nitrate/nitrite response regulator NarL
MKPKVIKSVAVFCSDATLAEWITGQLEKSLHFRVACRCFSSEEVLKLSLGLLADLALVGVSLENNAPIASIHALKRAFPRLPVVLTAEKLDLDSFLRAFQAGADGLILKPCAREAMEQILINALNGFRSFCCRSQRLLLDHLIARNLGHSSEFNLTSAEQRIVNYLIGGLSDKQIAVATGLSTATIHSFTAHIYKKLHVHNRQDAVNQYLGLGASFKNAEPNRKNL